MEGILRKNWKQYIKKSKWHKTICVHVEQCVQRRGHALSTLLWILYYHLQLLKRESSCAEKAFTIFNVFRYLKQVTISTDIDNVVSDIYSS